jgi:hypothetical protein
MSEIDAAELARLRECVAASGWEIGFEGKLYPVLALLDELEKARADAIAQMDSHDAWGEIWTAKLDAAVAERDTARALPFLAPQPTQSDEKKVHEILVLFSRLSEDEDFETPLLSLLAVVRAEATLAGAAAERERNARWLEDRNGEFLDALAAKDAQIAALESREAAFLAYEKNRDDEVAKLRANIAAAREACAKIADGRSAYPIARNIAAAIRAMSS